MKNFFRKFVPIFKVDAAKRQVEGVIAEEAVDKANEIFDYESSKSHVQKWSSGFEKTTNGLSVGNVRAMHSSIAAGKLTTIAFDDAKKQISVTASIVDDNEWKKVEAGVYTGFSIGGRYIKKWSDGAAWRYTAAPAEVSIVDNPCMYGATFTAVKADGAQEMRKFVGGELKKQIEVDGVKYELAKAAKTKSVGGKEVAMSEFAYVGDPEKTATWKLPIMDASHVRNALARFNQTQGIPEGEKAAVLARIKAKAKSFGIDASDDAEKMAKSLADVGCLADIISRLDWITECLEYEREYEGDESTVPDELDAAVKGLCEILLALAAEETSELTAEDANKYASKENEEMTAEEKKKFDEMQKENADLKDKLAKAATPATSNLVEIGTTADGVKIFKKVDAPAADPKDEKIAKLEGEVAELNKGFEELHEGLQKILAVPDKPAVVANPAAKGALGKSTDTGEEVDRVDFEKMSTIDQIKYQQSLSKPELPFRPLS
jgi:hypothetical protein